MMTIAKRFLGTALFTVGFFSCYGDGNSGSPPDRSPDLQDMTDYTYSVPAGPVGSFADFPVSRTFDKEVEHVTLTITAGDADDIGYVGSLLVTDIKPQCQGVGHVNSSVDVSSQVTLNGNTASFLLRAQENCCCTTGWGPATSPGRLPATFAWKVWFKGCPACSQPMCTSYANNSADFSVGLGQTGYGDTLAKLFVSEKVASASASTPAGLQVSGGSDLFVARNLDGSLRQVKSAAVLADIVAVTSYRYEIRLYPASQAGSLVWSPNPVGAYLYQPSGSPVKTIAVENPDGAASFNRLNFTETMGSNSTANTFEYTSASQQWKLVQGNGLRQETRGSAVDSSAQDRTETHLIQNPDSSVVFKEINVFHAFPWGESKTKQVIDPDGAALTTTYAYVTNSSSNGYTQLQQMVQPGGYWERYEYDSTGRRAKTVKQFLDAPLGSAENASRVDVTTYNDLMDPVVTVVETLLGQEISRHYTVKHPGETRDIVATTPGAAYSDTNNLATITRKIQGGTFDGQLLSVKNPDATMSLYRYAISFDGAQRTTTVKTGQPNSTETDIVDGTETVTVNDQAGNQLSQTAYDISSGLLLTSAITTQQDAFGRPTRVEYNDGTFVSTSYGCCGVDTQTDREGITTSYIDDDLKRVIATTRAGITTLTGYDAVDHVLKTTRVGSDNSQITTNISTYDVAGRQTSSTDALGNPTTFSESFEGNPGHKIRATTFPNGSTQVEAFFQDGSNFGLTGSGVHGLTWQYGVDADGPFTQEFRTGTGESIRTSQDMAGRSHKTVLADGAASQNYFNQKGQMVRQTDPDGVGTLFDFNGKGEQQDAATDMDRNGVIDFGGTDRITRTVNDVVTDHGVTVQRSTVSVWTTDGDAAATSVVAVNETSADGLQSWDTQFGLTTHSQTVYDHVGGRTVTITNPDGSTTVNQYQQGRQVSTTQQDAQGHGIGGKTWTFDPHGRLASETDARGAVTRLAYSNGDQILSSSIRDSVSGVAETTSFAFNNMGWQTQATLPDGGMVISQYYDTGELFQTFGSRTYRVQYGIDSQGRVQTQTTFRGPLGSGMPSPEITTWKYDWVRGFLHSKSYPDGKGPSYGYTAAGRLASRKWARGTVTSYAYNPAGEVSGVSYSDGTPSVHFFFDRRGRKVDVSSGVEQVAMAYNDANQPLVETHRGGPLDGVRVTRGYDALLRRSFLSAFSSAFSLQSSAYTYDSASRLASASSVERRAPRVSYSYWPNSSLVKSLTFSKGDQKVMTTTKAWDELNRLTSISSASSAFAYVYNLANQRIRVDESHGRHWLFGYDALGQVIYGKRNQGEDFEYAFDTIGNRISTKINHRASNYTANDLNQYTQVSNARGAVESDEEDKDEDEGHSHGASRRRAEFSYDADGNLLSDGDWNYSWDAENRLMAMERRMPRKERLEFVYDDQGRRISKRVTVDGLTKVWNGVYDGWNKLAEMDQKGKAVQNYLWGQDLSGSVQGAGGVGGLLMISSNVEPRTSNFIAMDGNGNVAALVDASTGKVSAQYEYGPFGEPIRATGTMAKANPYRFSTKYEDVETGLYDFGGNIYNPSTGRWLRRDRAGEFRGGPNLYAFVANDPVNSFDLLGLADPNTPSKPNPSQVNGFTVVGTTIDDWYGGFLQSLGVDHVDIAYNGTVIYVGRGGAAGRKNSQYPQTNHTYSLAKKTSGVMKIGKRANCLACKDATDSDIIEALQSRKPTAGYNCQGDVQQAISEVCLTGFRTLVSNLFPGVSN